MGKKSNHANASQVYGTDTNTIRGGKQDRREAAQVPDSQNFHPQTNNFIPSSNLSQFLLKKGSNGSLHTFENEYSYKINLENLNSNVKGQG
jgi:hypothetical protein